MPSVDPSYTDLPLYLLPAAGLIGLLAIPRAIKTSREVTRWFVSMARGPGDLRPGPGHFEVLATAETNLGHSSESKTPTGTPTLVGEPVVLQMVAGPPIRLAPGASIVVRQFPGARRRHVDTTTTEQGVRNRISFDVPANMRFWLEADLAAPPAEGYRAGAVVEARPIKGKYIVQATPFGPPNIVNLALAYLLSSALVGLFVGFFVTMMWRTGCRSGRFPVPTAALADAAVFAILFASIGLHMGLGSAVPEAMRPPRGPPAAP